MVSSQGRGKQRWKWWPRLRLDPRSHTLSRSCSHEGSDSIVVSIALKTGILFHSCVHYGLHLPAPLVPGRTLEKQGWGQSWPSTMPRSRLPWSFLKFHKASCPATGPAPPLSLCSRVSSVKSGLHGRACVGGLGRVSGGMAWLGFSMEMNSSSQAPGWVGCALGAMSQSFLLQQDGIRG